MNNVQQLAQWAVGQGYDTDYRKSGPVERVRIRNPGVDARAMAAKLGLASVDRKAPDGLWVTAS